tara:strand:+ start:28 stop:201 length:174 start_codon:yes stop_codon:yes gene_type:complete
MNVGNSSRINCGNCPAIWFDILDLDSGLTSDGTGGCVTVVVGVVHDPTLHELFVIFD